MIKVNGYAIGEQIYQGSRTLVYRGVKQEGQLPVVLKTTRNLQPTQLEISRLATEYELARTIDHENFVRLIELARDTHRPVLVMEDFGGRSLAESFDEPLSADDFLCYARQLVRAVAALHRERIVHKDINPTNVIVHRERSLLKLADLGIASVLHQETRTTDDNLRDLEGTLRYISPEQTGRVELPIDERTDLYAIGATFYEMLCGQAPFESDDPMEIVHGHIARPPTPPRQHRADVPPLLSAMVLKLLAKPARDRYQTAEGLLADLDRFAALHAEGSDGSQITPFPLGHKDISSRFRLPHKLYGRGPARTTMATALERAVEGSRQLLLIEGAPGSGKSALLQQFHGPVTRKGGWFLRGSFSRTHQDRPFVGLAEALGQLVEQLLSRSEAELVDWRQRIGELVGEDGRLLVQLLPRLALLIGDQPAAATADPTDAERRFARLTCGFLSLFSQRQSPLVIVLDDLHHADASSLRLIERMLADEEIHHLLIVASKMETASGDDLSPLSMMLRALSQSAAEVKCLTVGSLEVGHVTQLLVDAFRADNERAQELAEVLHRKSTGNPFFLRQLLMALHAEELITFAHGAWHWDLAAIAQRRLFDDVADLILAKMEALPRDTREVLELACCIGATFDLGTLAVIANRPVHEIAATLVPAVNAAIVSPSSVGFSQLLTHEFAANCCPLEHARGVRLSFVHDRFVQAVYQRIDDEARARQHLAIAELIKKRPDPGQGDDAIFEVVHHLEQGRALIVDPKEQLAAASLHYQAGQQAEAALAWDAARHHYGVAHQQLPAEAWDLSYELSFGIHLQLSFSYTLLKEVKPWMLELGEELMTHARTLEHRLLAMAPYSLRLSRAKRPEQALELTFELLRDAGIELDPPDVDLALEQGRAELAQAMGSRTIAQLAELPVMTDPEKIALARLLHATLLPLYMRRRELVPLSELAAIKLTVVYGLGPDSVISLAGWGRIVAHVYGDFDSGYAFGKVGHQLAHLATMSKAGTQAIISSFTQWLREPLQDAIRSLRESLRLGVERGETFYIGLAASMGQSLAFAQGELLEPLAAELAVLDRHISRTMGDVGLREIHFTRRAVATLMANRSDLELFEPEEDQPALKAQMLSQNPEALAWYYLLSARLCFLMGQWQRAEELAALACDHVDRTVGALAGYDAIYHHALCLAAVAKEDHQHALLAEHTAQLTLWCDKGLSTNFGHKLELVKAETARIAGDASAAQYYEAAIEGAAAGGFLADQALANELAGQHYLSRSLERVARVYLQEARYCYEKWGATIKVQQLDQRYPFLQDENVSRPITSEHATLRQTSTTGTSLSTRGVLDFAAVMKASQVISGEVALSSLLEKLLAVIGESAGASRAMLVLRDESDILRLYLSSEQQQPVWLEPPRALDEATQLSTGICYFVARTGEPVVLADAAIRGNFRADPYVARQRPRSLLCAPLSNQGKLVGLVYLENNFAHDVFTDERLQVVKLLTAQAAISINNARLFEELALSNRTLEQKVRERTRDLAGKNDALNQSLAREREMQQQLVIHEKMASLGNLVAGVAHEINTPVGAVVSSVDTATRCAQKLRRVVNEGDTAGRKLDRLFGVLDDNHGVISTAGQRVAEIVRTLRSFARLDEAERKEVDVHEGIDSTLTLARHRLKRGIEVVRDYGRIPEVTCYPDQLNQVFMNLLVNAIDAIEQRTRRETDHRGRIAISSMVAPSNGSAKSVRLAFTDNGNGIAKEQLQQIFNPGFTTKGVGVGTGLGLAICYNIVDKHQGRIEVQSEPGCGTTFTVVLPIEQP